MFSIGMSPNENKIEKIEREQKKVEAHEQKASKPQAPNGKKICFYL